MIEDMVDPQTGKVNMEDFYILYNVLMEEFMPTNSIRTLRGFRRLNADEKTIYERMRAAAVIIFMAHLISKKCQLGYLIDLMSKEAGWETVILAAHPERFKEFLVPVGLL